MKITKKDTSREDTGPFPPTFGTVKYKAKKKKEFVRVHNYVVTHCAMKTYGGVEV
jgi:hypothetical protein